MARLPVATVQDVHEGEGRRLAESLLDALTDRDEDVDHLLLGVALARHVEGLSHAAAVPRDEDVDVAQLPVENDVGEAAALDHLVLAEGRLVLLDREGQHHLPPLLDLSLLELDPGGDAPHAAAHLDAVLIGEALDLAVHLRMRAPLQAAEAHLRSSSRSAREGGQGRAPHDVEGLGVDHPEVVHQERLVLDHRHGVALVDHAVAAVLDLPAALADAFGDDLVEVAALLRAPGEGVEVAHLVALQVLDREALPSLVGSSSHGAIEALQVDSVEPVLRPRVHLDLVEGREVDAHPPGRQVASLGVVEVVAHDEGQHGLVGLTDEVVSRDQGLHIGSRHRNSPRKWTESAYFSRLNCVRTVNNIAYFYYFVNIHTLNKPKIR